MMEVYEERGLQVIGKSMKEILNSQMEIFNGQIDDLETLVFTQSSLTAVNPLSQEMAAGALSIKIGKRPRDLLNPKAIKYMESVFSIKDAIGKKETAELSAHLGITASQVREFFNSQRTRVRKFVRLSGEKGLRFSSFEQVVGGVQMGNDLSETIYPTPLNCMEPVPLNSIEPVPLNSIEPVPLNSMEPVPLNSMEPVPLNSMEPVSLNSMEPVRVKYEVCSTAPVEVVPGLDESEKYFQENIFSEMRKEETIGGQVKLMEWILQIQNSSLLLWFLNNGGVMILATWLTEAASEEQTSVLHTILKVLCHLPLQKALPVHMSAILQSVNKLRYYEASDISNRARNLLSRWSKMFARAQASKKPSGVKSSCDAENEMLLKQSINEIMGDESWGSNLTLPGISSFEISESSRRLEGSQPLKLLTASADDSNKKTFGNGSPFHMRERRKVLMVEHPGQKPAGRSSQVARSAAVNRSRPLSADDIQKAKLRAQFMQNKNGKSQTSQAKPLVSPSKAQVQPEVEEHKAPAVSLPLKVSVQKGASPAEKINFDVDGPLWKKYKKVQIKWKSPAEMRIPDEWSVGTGENSNEIEVQLNRNRREKETVYRTTQEIPCNPNEPWDREMEYDDTLTLEIPIEQLPDNENEETEPSNSQAEPTPSISQAPSYVSENTNDVNFAEADPQLLAELLKHPELVFALQGGGLSGDEMVKLLDMIKSNGVAALGGNALANTGPVAPIAEDNVPVSLPSPTPSSDPVTSGWRTNVNNNPFSRQEREPMYAMAQQQHQQQQLQQQQLQQQQLQQRVQVLPQQAMPQYPLAHATANLPQLPTQATNSMNIRQTNHWAQSSGYADPAQFSVSFNRTPERQLTPPLQPQTRFIPEQSWAHDQHQVSVMSNNRHYMQPHHPNNYNGYVQQSPPLRKEYVGEAEYESWSPENSPVKPSVWGLSEQRMNPNVNSNPNPNMGYYNNYRPEYDLSSRQWNSSGFRDFNGPGESKRQRR